MKKYFWMSFCAAALLLAPACEKNETEVRFDGRKVTQLSVGLPAGTKTHMGTLEGGVRKVYWSDGDVVSVNGVASSALTGLGDQAASALFSFEGVLNAPYKAVYPSTIWTSDGEITLPASQKWKKDGFAEGMNPMAAYTTDGSSLQMKHLCALLKLSVKLDSGANADADKISFISFSGNAGEQVSGVFDIDYATAALTSASAADEDKKVQVSLGQTLSATEALDVYIAVPARTYASGFTLTIQDEMGHVMTKSTSSSKTLSAGHILNMPEFTFVPTSTTLGIEIPDAATLVQFAHDYNAGVYEGVSGLVATLTNDIVFDATTSAAYEGIGSKNGDDTNYFNGYFNGNGKTISSYVGNKPIFVYTGGSALVRGITMDNSCTVTRAADYGLHIGTLVGRHKGRMADCHSAAILVLNMQGDGEWDYGGLVGYAFEDSEIDSCSYSGQLTIPSNQTVTGDKSYVGGIVGVTSGTVRHTEFAGHINLKGSSTTQGVTCDALYLGGIAGNSGDGSLLEDCTCSGSSNIDVRGLQTKLCLAGISGLSAGTISGCINEKNVYVRGKTNTNHTPAYIGGIVGQSTATLLNCTNKGSVTGNVGHKSTYIGGISGIQSKSTGTSDGSVTNCHNTGNVSRTLQYTPRYYYAGGCFGYYRSGALDDVTNSGAVSDEEGAGANLTNSTCYIGGFAGMVDVLSGGGSVSNSGKVTVKLANGTSNLFDFAVGGVVGYAKGAAAAVSGVKNTNSVTVTLDDDVSHYTVAQVGGIVGKADAAVSDAQNEGAVGVVIGTTVADNTLYYSNIYLAGGVGRAAGELSALTNSGNVTLNGAGWYTRDNRIGGIAAYASADVKNCTNNNRVLYSGKADATIAQTGNIAGGILADSDADITLSRNTNNGEVNYDNAATKMNGRYSVIGGIAGRLVGAVTVDKCDNYGFVNNRNFNNSNGDANSAQAGGIVGRLQGTSAEAPAVMTDCHHYAPDGSNPQTGRRGLNGGLVSVAQNAQVQGCSSVRNIEGVSGDSYFGGLAVLSYGSTFKNCSYTGSLSKTGYAAGFVYNMDAASVLDACVLDVTMTPTNAAASRPFAAITKAGTVIKNCRYKGSFNGVALTAETDLTDGNATLENNTLITE